MDIHRIRNERDHARALKRVEKLWGARRGTTAAEELEILATLIDAYEAKHHPIDPPDPIDAILFRLEQRGLTRADLVPIIGSRSRVSEVLNRRRELTVAMIVRIREKLGIPADVLIGRERAALGAAAARRLVPQVPCRSFSASWARRTEPLPDRHCMRPADRSVAIVSHAVSRLRLGRPRPLGRSGAV